MTMAYRTLLQLPEKDWNYADLVGAGRSASRVRTVTLDGEVSAPPLTERQAELYREAIVALADSDEPEPLVFTLNPDLTGWYRVLRSTAKLRRHDDGADDIVQVQWTLHLERLGSTLSDCSLESQLVGATRANDHGIGTGERWHALPSVAVAPWYGSSSPSELTRSGTFGVSVKVFRDIPADVPARYGLTPAAAQLYCPLVIISESVVKVGQSGAVDAADWSVTNSLLRVRHSTSEAFRFAISDGVTGWDSELDYRVRLGTTALGVPDSVQVLQNAIHTASVRLTWTVVGVGIVTCDLTMRRGAHHVAFVLRTNSAATLRMEVNEAAATARTGYVEDTADDADGNRWLIGSPETNTTSSSGSWTGLQETSTLVFDGYVGMELGGSAAASGNEGDDIRDQYLEDRAELVRVTAP